MVEAEIFGGNAVGHGDVLTHYSRALGKTTTKHPPPAVPQKDQQESFHFICTKCLVDCTALSVY